MTPLEIRCLRCGDDTGPFDPDADPQPMCEHCAAPVPLDRLQPTA